jgi:hypothetical protein
VTGWRFLHGLGKIIAVMIRCGFDGVCLLAIDLVDMECRVMLIGGDEGKELLFSGNAINGTAKV